MGTIELSGAAAQDARSSEAALAELDAVLAHEGSNKWQRFYADRARPCPFFGLAPDENLHQWLEEGQLAPGRALDLGCGNGRNAILLARHGFDVQAADYSAAAAAWACEEVTRAGVPVSIMCTSVFDLQLAPGGHSLIYDSGCFHHIAPHRRQQYVCLVAAALRAGGAFGLVCFAPEGGSGLSDDQVYEQHSLGGGLGYDEQRLRDIWSGAFRIASLRRMRERDASSGLFGRRDLWAMLAYRN